LNAGFAGRWAKLRLLDLLSASERCSPRYLINRAAGSGPVIPRVVIRPAGIFPMPSVLGVALGPAVTPLLGRRCGFVGFGVGVTGHLHGEANSQKGDSGYQKPHSNLHGAFFVGWGISVISATRTKQ
jgi:hypothetical protein